MSDKKNTIGSGYKRPPKQHQFRPGVSGNPSGRPKSVASLKSDLRDELSKLVAMREGGSEVALTKQRALVKTLVDAAIKGDGRSISIIFGFYEALSSDEGNDASLSSEDHELVRDYAERTKQDSNARSTTEKEPEDN